MSNRLMSSRLMSKRLMSKRLMSTSNRPVMPEATAGTRTPNLRFTKPLLCQLSYGGASAECTCLEPTEAACRQWFTHHHRLGCRRAAMHHNKALFRACLPDLHKPASLCIAGGRPDQHRCTQIRSARSVFICIRLCRTAVPSPRGGVGRIPGSGLRRCRLDHTRTPHSTPPAPAADPATTTTPSAGRSGRRESTAVSKVGCPSFETRFQAKGRISKHPLSLANPGLARLGRRRSGGRRSTLLGIGQWHHRR